MRGLLNGQWHEIEQDAEASGWLGYLQFSIKDDPEAGIFDEREFEQIGHDDVEDIDAMFAIASDASKPRPVMQADADATAKPVCKAVSQ